MFTTMSVPTPLKRLAISSLGLLLSFNVFAQEPFPFTSAPVAEFNEPWAMEFLPDGRMLVTEKTGAIYLVTQDGGKTEVAGAPEVDYFFQGGMGDVVLHPDFEANSIVYVSYVEAGPNETRGAVVARGTLDLNAPAINGLEVIWRATPKVEGGLHFSHRMIFDDEGHLFVSVGERNEKTPAQDMNSNLGKIVRLNDDGTPAAGNPFASQGGVAAEIWSLGHRNPLGIDFDASGQLWNTEMGPRGGDELNLVEAGNNYGYPVVSNGSDYNGDIIPHHDNHPEFETPKVWWNPSISPGSLMIYKGDRFPQWTGNALIGALGGQALVRVQFNRGNAVEAARYPMGKRIREVEEGPDGYIWLLEDGAGGRLVKLSPR